MIINKTMRTITAITQPTFSFDPCHIFQELKEGSQMNNIVCVFKKLQEIPKNRAARLYYKKEINIYLKRTIHIESSLQYVQVYVNGIFMKMLLIINSYSFFILSDSTNIYINAIQWCFIVSLLDYIYYGIISLRRCRDNRQFCS